MGSPWRASAVLASLALAGTARADTATDAAALVTQGQQLAEQRELALAIEKFKAADLIMPRAVHACLIGLAYLRLDRLAQAELFLARCHDRAKPDDPAPPWQGDAERQLAAAIAAAGAPAVTFAVEPPVDAVIALSGFAPDETFAPRTLHLAPGAYTVSAHRVGEPARSGRADVVVVAATPATVTIRLEVPDQAVDAIPTAVAPRSRPRRARWILVGAGVAALAGVGFHALAYDRRTALAGAPTGSEYDAAAGSFRTYRAVTVGCYAVAAIAAGIGVALWRSERGGPRVSGAVSGDGAGAVLVMEWRR